MGFKLKLNDHSTMVMRHKIGQTDTAVGAVQAQLIWGPKHRRLSLVDVPPPIMAPERKPSLSDLDFDIFDGGHLIVDILVLLKAPLLVDVNLGKNFANLVLDIHSRRGNTDFMYVKVYFAHNT